MPKVAVVTDSSPYIPEDIIKKNNIQVVPLTVIWGEENFYDGVDITPVQFYERLDKAKVMPSTSQPFLSKNTFFIIPAPALAQATSWCKTYTLLNPNSLLIRVNVPAKYFTK